MTLWSRIRSWLSATLRRSRMERDMDAELRFHVEAYAEDLHSCRTAWSPTCERDFSCCWGPSHWFS